MQVSLCSNQWFFSKSRSIIQSYSILISSISRKNGLTNIMFRCMCVHVSCVYHVVCGSPGIAGLLLLCWLFTTDVTCTVLKHVPHPCRCLWIVQVSYARCQTPVTRSMQVAPLSSQTWSTQLGLLCAIEKGPWFSRAFVRPGMWSCSQTLTRPLILLSLFARLLVTWGSNKQRYKFTKCKERFRRTQDTGLEMTRSQWNLPTPHHTDPHVYFSGALLSNLEDGNVAMWWQELNSEAMTVVALDFTVDLHIALRTPCSYQGNRAGRYTPWTFLQVFQGCPIVLTPSLEKYLDFLAISSNYSLGDFAY